MDFKFYDTRSNLQHIIVEVNGFQFYGSTNNRKTVKFNSIQIFRAIRYVLTGYDRGANCFNKL